jgi:hypothetical protein
MKRPAFLWLLVLLLVFLGLGGLYGGIAMLSDPSGRGLQMDQVLPLLPVPDYVLPGVFLLVVMGLLPLLLAYGAIWRPGWGWAESITGWSRHDWPWTGSMALGMLLVLWLAIQALWLGFRWPIQYVTLANGLLIIGVAMVPSVRAYFAHPPGSA